MDSVPPSYPDSGDRFQHVCSALFRSLASQKVQTQSCIGHVAGVMFWSGDKQEVVLPHALAMLRLDLEQSPGRMRAAQEPRSTDVSVPRLCKAALHKLAHSTGTVAAPLRNTHARCSSWLRLRAVGRSQPGSVSCCFELCLGSSRLNNVRVTLRLV